MLITGLGLTALMVAVVLIFVYTAPQFGQKPRGTDLERFKNSPNYRSNEFINLIWQ